MTGGDRLIETLRRTLPAIKTMSPKSIKACFVRYIALGGMGYFPNSCWNSVIFVPVNIAPWLWGWPDRFLRCMHARRHKCFAVDTYKAGGTKGLNDSADLKKLSKAYSGSSEILNLPDIFGTAGFSDRQHSSVR